MKWVNSARKTSTCIALSITVWKDQFGKSTYCKPIWNIINRFFNISLKSLKNHICHNVCPFASQIKFITWFPIRHVSAFRIFWYLATKCFAECELSVSLNFHQPSSHTAFLSFQLLFITSFGEMKGVLKDNTFTRCPNWTELEPQRNSISSVTSDAFPDLSSIVSL